MSAPDTTIPRQTRRHAASLIGMALAVLGGVGLIAWWVLGTTSGETPAEGTSGTLMAPQDGAQPTETTPGQ